MKKKTTNKNKKNRNNKCKECTIKINKSNLVKGIYTSTLEKLIKSKLNVKNINVFIKTNIILIKNEISRSYNRESRIPKKIKIFFYFLRLEMKIIFSFLTVYKVVCKKISW